MSKWRDMSVARPDSRIPPVSPAGYSLNSS